MDFSTLSKEDGNDKEEVAQLERRLRAIRQRRQRVAHYKEQMETQSSATLTTLNQLRKDRVSVIEEYQSVLFQRKNASAFLHNSQRWNVTNDCFHIWHNGPFATINGMRLGSEAPPLHFLQGQNALSPTAGTSNSTISTLITSTNASSNQKDYRSQQHPPPTTTQQPPQRRIWGWSGSQVAANELSKPPQDIQKVPWAENNAALGYAAFLFQILVEKNPSFKSAHTVIPMASTSKIVIGGGKSQQQKQVYNLYFDESSYSLFFRQTLRNFNIALSAFLQCVAEASAEQKDKTIAIPHAITKTMAGDWKVGGLSIQYDTTKPVEWTRACKYLLTDLKWLVAYSAKHYDR